MNSLGEKKVSTGGKIKIKVKNSVLLQFMFFDYPLYMPLIKLILKK